MTIYPRRDRQPTIYRLASSLLCPNPVEEEDVLVFPLQLTEDARIIQTAYADVATYMQRQKLHGSFRSMTIVPAEPQVMLTCLEQTAGAQLQHTFVADVLASHTEETWDRIWLEQTYRGSVYQMALQIEFLLESLNYMALDYTTAYRVNVSAWALLTALLEKVFGQNNVAVSHQLIGLQQLLSDWPEFCTQSEAALLFSDPCGKAKYAEQKTPAGTIHYPVYGIPVGIRKVWPRHIVLDDYTAFVSQLKQPFTSHPIMDRVTDRMYPMTKGFTTLSTYGDLQCKKDTLDNMFDLILAGSSDLIVRRPRPVSTAVRFLPLNKLFRKHV